MTNSPVLTQHLVWLGILSVLTFEVVWWAVILDRHAHWMFRHISDAKERRHCFMKRWRRVHKAAIMASSLSVMCFLLECYVIRKVYQGSIPRYIYLPWVIAGLQISHIEFYKITAECSCLERCYWPPLTRFFAKVFP